MSLAEGTLLAIIAALVVGGGLITNLAKDPPTANIGLATLLAGLGGALAYVAFGVVAVIFE